MSRHVCMIIILSQLLHLTPLIGEYFCHHLQRENVRMRNVFGFSSAAGELPRVVWAQTCNLIHSACRKNVFLKSFSHSSAWTSVAILVPIKKFFHYCWWRKISSTCREGNLNKKLFLLQIMKSFPWTFFSPKFNFKFHIDTSTKKRQLWG